MLPVWVSEQQIVKEAERLNSQKQQVQQSKAERIAEQKRKLQEEKIRQEREAAALSSRQAQFRRENGAKVASLVAGIEPQINNFREGITQVLNAKGSLTESIKGTGFFRTLPRWYA